MNNILELCNITKKYPGVIALDNVSFKVKKGTIHSLVGENGAGKSTLLKVISGVIPHSRYSGKVKYRNELIRFNGIKDSENKKIVIIHQELAISENLTVLENIFLGSLKNKMGFVKWNLMRKQAKKYLKMVGLENVNLEEKVGMLSVAKQQMIEIVKALSKKCELLILDEPTASLNDDDAFKLLDLMKKLRDEQNMTCIFVSHKLKEVEYVADAITIIRDGKHISDYFGKDKVTEKRLINDIVGRDMESKFPKKSLTRKIGDVVFEVINYSVASKSISNLMVIKDVNFNLRKGEVVGISGLVGTGRTELALSIFGQSFGKKISGKVKINKLNINLNSPKKAINLKIMYVSEDRKNIGLIQKFSINQNISMASLPLFSKLGILNKFKEFKNSLNMKSKLNIKVPGIEYDVDTLSGGNQQKVLIAKALTTNFDILIIDEPTKGIDVGSKFEIYKIIDELASEGKSIIVISSEIEELLGITDRVFVMSQGEIKGEMPTNKATPEKIMQLAIGNRGN